MKRPTSLSRASAFSESTKRPIPSRNWPVPRSVRPPARSCPVASNASRSKGTATPTGLASFAMADENDDVVTVERIIPAPPEKIFELLAHADRHREIDGSGTVRDPAAAGERLKLGSTFDMKMKLGVPYTMTNTVVEFEEGRRIAWQP